jgi:hypothetical protein
MTPREFLEAVVRLDVAEFRDEYGSIRRAYHAVTAVDALAALRLLAPTGLRAGRPRVSLPKVISARAPSVVISGCPERRKN